MPDFEGKKALNYSQNTSEFLQIGFSSSRISICEN